MCVASTTPVTWTRRWISFSYVPARALISTAHHWPTANFEESPTSKRSDRSGIAALRLCLTVVSVTVPRKERTAPKGLSWVFFSMSVVWMWWPPKSSSMLERLKRWRRVNRRSVWASMRWTVGSLTMASSAASAGVSASKWPKVRKSRVPVWSWCQRPVFGVVSGAMTVPPLCGVVDFLFQRRAMVPPSPGVS